ncbi:MAG: GNAT family N-acetyltransferase [Promethearchaeota archaeon]
MNKEIKTRVRCYAIEGLGKIKDINIIKYLRVLLRDENIYIKKSVILALADIGDKSAVNILLDQLNCEEDWLKSLIVWSLGKIKDSRCINTLIEMFSEKNLKFELKKSLIIALSNFGDKRVVKLLIKMLKDQHSGLEDYLVLALEEIGDRKALPAIIKLFLNPIWFLKEHYNSIINKYCLNLKYILNDYSYRIYKRDDLPTNLFKNFKDKYEWHYGYLNKSHYVVDKFNKILGCLNLIFIKTYNNVSLFYWDTIEIKEDYRRIGLGTTLTEFIIENEVNKFKKFYIFLLVAKCEQYKLKFFSTLGFVPIKLRDTKVGTHCIMGYPFDKDSEIYCRKLFKFFHWRVAKREFISSDCKYAYNPNPTGLYWCTKKNIYVTGLEKKTCKYYIKDKEIFNENKFLDLKDLFSKKQKYIKNSI